jgi:hypothetical protein
VVLDSDGIVYHIFRCGYTLWALRIYLHWNSYLPCLEGKGENPLFQVLPKGVYTRKVLAIHQSRSSCTKISKEQAFEEWVVIFNDDNV